MIRGTIKLLYTGAYSANHMLGINTWASFDENLLIQGMTFDFQCAFNALLHSTAFKPGTIRVLYAANDIK
jgi:hypothetical protein